MEVDYDQLAMYLGARVRSCAEALRKEEGRIDGSTSDEDLGERTKRLLSMAEFYGTNPLITLQKGRDIPKDFPKEEGEPLVLKQAYLMLFAEATAEKYTREKAMVSAEFKRRLESQGMEEKEYRDCMRKLDVMYGHKLAELEVLKTFDKATLRAIVEQ